MASDEKKQGDHVVNDVNAVVRSLLRQVVATVAPSAVSVEAGLEAIMRCLPGASAERYTAAWGSLIEALRTLDQNRDAIGAVFGMKPGAAHPIMHAEECLELLVRPKKGGWAKRVEAWRPGVAQRTVEDGGSGDTNAALFGGMVRENIDAILRELARVSPPAQFYDEGRWRGLAARFFNGIARTCIDGGALVRRVGEAASEELYAALLGTCELLVGGDLPVWLGYVLQCAEAYKHREDCHAEYVGFCFPRFWHSRHCDYRTEGKCHACHKAAAQLQCSRCRSVLYCSRKCQKLNWFFHKLFCVPHAEKIEQ